MPEDSPPGEPAIILTGPTIRSMSPKGRAAFARSITNLLRVDATVGVVPPMEEPSEPIPSFSWVGFTGNTTRDSDWRVKVAEAIHPNSLTQIKSAKAGMTAVVLAPDRDRPEYDGLTNPFSYEFDEDSPGPRTLLGITVDTVLLATEPETVAESTHNLGLDRAKALIELARVTTTTWTYTPGNPFPFGPHLKRGHRVV